MLLLMPMPCGILVCLLVSPACNEIPYPSQRTALQLWGAIDDFIAGRHELLPQVLTPWALAQPKSLQSHRWRHHADIDPGSILRQ